MCGITGIFHSRSPQRPDEALLRRMNDIQFHRGPDEGSVHIEAHIGLGHRRLSIIDVATGQQPLFNEDGSRAERPVIEHAPDEIRYGKNFKIHVDLAEGADIQKVTLFRSGSSTHSNGANIRLVKLGFRREGNHLRVIAPRLPVQALPGDYTLFVVDERGVPSVAKHVRVLMEDGHHH